jgi:hypothetical protein
MNGSAGVLTRSAGCSERRNDRVEGYHQLSQRSSTHSRGVLCTQCMQYTEVEVPPEGGLRFSKLCETPSVVDTYEDRFAPVTFTKRYAASEVKFPIAFQGPH